MNESVTEVKIGQAVPDFEINAYNPVENSFDKVRLAELKQQKKWTILFFYPADFTFV
jgi:peroxiredoxin (alkyl hydroperoxide reductase subunit C)